MIAVVIQLFFEELLKVFLAIDFPLLFLLPLFLAFLLLLDPLGVFFLILTLKLDLLLLLARVTVPLASVFLLFLLSLLVIFSFINCSLQLLDYPLQFPAYSSVVSANIILKSSKFNQGSVFFLDSFLFVESSASFFPLGFLFVEPAVDHNLSLLVAFDLNVLLAELHSVEEAQTFENTFQILELRKPKGRALGALEGDKLTAFLNKVGGDTLRSFSTLSLASSAGRFLMKSFLASRGSKIWLLA